MLMMTDEKKTINNTDAQHIADLVKLDINGQEEYFANILSDTLKYVEVLDELDTKGIQETYQVTGLVNVFQKEGLNATLTKEESLSNANQKVNGLFVADAVFDR
jgi:aspartyl-tRNA(Asn)/glutamyl-tRNA(Gln) amidotransferase subunit C